MYNTRIETLKGFYERIEIEFKKMVGFCRKINANRTFMASVYSQPSLQH